MVKGLTLAGADSASVYSGPYAQWARRTPTAARALRCLRVSFHPDELNMTIGGWSHTALEKLYGARLTRPSASRVEIQPIGRGATIALNGSCGRP